jgi:hypothetical protein
VIKADIKRVLDRMQVQYREVKGGFECIHTPSIDISSVQATPASPRHRRQPSTGSNDTGQGHGHTLVKKVSKLSFGIIKGRDKETDDKDLPSRPSGATTLATTPSSGSSSFFNVSSYSPTVHADVPRPDVNGTSPTSPPDESSPPTATPTKAKMLPPIPRDFAPPTSPPHMPTGEVNKEVFEIMGANTLAVRFEINIVKVCAKSLFVSLTLVDIDIIHSRYPGYHYMASSFGEQAVMAGNIKC